MAVRSSRRSLYLIGTHFKENIYVFLVFKVVFEPDNTQVVHRSVDLYFAYQLCETNHQLASVVEGRRPARTKDPTTDSPTRPPYLLLGSALCKRALWDDLRSERSLCQHVSELIAFREAALNTIIINSELMKHDGRL